MKLLLVLSMLGLSACAGLNRSATSGYWDYESDGGERATDIYDQRRNHVETEAREELGLLGRPLSEDEQSAVENRIRLKRMESKIATRREKRQYFQVRSSLKSDRERIYFLSLPNYEARERWSRSRGLVSQEESYTDDVAQLIETNDIAMGMSKKAVLESWGDPDQTEVAGNPIYGYERWKYNRYVSGSDGYQKELRIVYFEGGRVVGWERN